MKLSREDLWSLEEYAQERAAFRQDVITCKKDRRVAMGPNATLYFENRLTMRYQIQEMLRVERIFESAAIEEEIESYNPLIPDGTNWKATFMIEYSNPTERAKALAKMGGIELTIWVKVGGGEKIYAITNEDMERTRDEKAAAVHFARFELATEEIADLKNGAPLSMGIDHPSIPCAIEIEGDTRAALISDLA
jgi:hypothetical protein